MNHPEMAMRSSNWQSRARRHWPGALAALLTLSVGCADSAPPSAPLLLPSNGPATAPQAPPGPLAAAPAFPALQRKGEIFSGPDDLYDFASATHRGHLASRYVLYEDGTFGLQFSSAGWGFFEYTGWFTRDGARIAFDFDMHSTSGPTTAVGTLDGDSLSVAYNMDMLLSDFVDGVYVRSPAAQ
jgi:hypothetical protein